jgi:hypothetical protein
MRTANRALLLALLVITPALAAPAPFVPPTRPRPAQPVPFDPTAFKTIRVDVTETSTGSLMFGLGVNSDAGFTGSIVLNESPGAAFRTAPVPPRPPAPPQPEPPSVAAPIGTALPPINVPLPMRVAPTGTPLPPIISR